jgi:hypothetical protein
MPAGATKVALMRGSTELHALTSNSRPPTITITSPRAGDRWQAASDIMWTASDSAGRPLTFSVLYSSDGGTKWLPISLDQTETTYNLNIAEIMGGSRVMFRVLATAGLDVASADVGPITVTQDPRISGPSAVEFGAQRAGKSIDQTVTVESTGTGPLTIGAVTVSGAGYTLLTAAPTYPLPIGTSWTGTVRYTASGTGGQAGTLTIASNDATRASLRITLNGTASGAAVPNLRADASVDFGDTSVGAIQELTFEIANAGDATLNITSASISGAAFKLVSPSGAFSVSARATQSITVRFQPAAAGSATGTLTLRSNDPVRAAVNITLTGNGLVAKPVPQINAGGVVNAASFTPTLVRGGLASIFGTNFPLTSVSAKTLPLPTLLGGASVTVGGIPAAVFFVSNAQINFQVPSDAPLGSNIRWW